MLNLEKPIDSYIFGFIQGDGHLYQQSRNRGKLSIELHVRDKDILEKISGYFNYNCSIRERTRKTNFSEKHTSAILTACSWELRKSLVSLGIPYGKKSDIIAPPTTAFIKVDYVRGLVDAEGSIGFTSQGFPFVSIAISSEAIYQFYKQFLFDELGAIKKLNRNTRDNIYNVMVTREDAQQLVKLLYYKDAFALNRKTKAARKVEEWIRLSSIKKRNLY